MVDLYLEYLCHSCINVFYLRTFFYTQLIDKENCGWARAKCSFNVIISNCLPSFGQPLSTAPMIILSIYSRPYLHWTILVQMNHWKKQIYFTPTTWTLSNWSKKWNIILIVLVQKKSFSLKMLHGYTVNCQPNDYTAMNVVLGRSFMPPY